MRLLICYETPVQLLSLRVLYFRGLLVRYRNILMWEVSDTHGDLHIVTMA